MIFVIALQMYISNNFSGVPGVCIDVFSAIGT